MREALTIMPTMPRPAYSITLLPHLLRLWDSNHRADDLVAGYDWESIPETPLLYYCIGVADADSKDFDQDLE